MTKGNEEQGDGARAMERGVDGEREKNQGFASPTTAQENCTYDVFI